MVAVPRLVPVIYTFAPTRGSLVPLSLTIPAMLAELVYAKLYVNKKTEINDLVFII